MYIPVNFVLRNTLIFLRKLFIQLVNKFLLLLPNETARMPAGFSPKRYIIFANVQFILKQNRPVIISLPHTTVSSETDTIGQYASAGSTNSL
jgi:hypothetical protein